MRIDEKSILLMEDNPDDELLTLVAFRDNKITNEIVFTRYGEEVLDFLFETGNFRDRDAHILPQIILPDLKLPKEKATNWEPTATSESLLIFINFSQAIKQ